MKRLTSVIIDNLVKHDFLFNGRIVSISCEPGSRVDTSIRAGHWYEHKMLGCITRTSRAGVFLDIGGNVGHHSIYFSLFAPSTQVFCYEPLPDHLRIIRTNIESNLLQNKMFIQPYGAAEEVTTFEMTTNAAKFQRRILGLCLPVDHSFSGPVTVIKIDVEGMELNVLRGLRDTLKNHRPDLYIECLTADQFTEVSEYLKEFDFVRDNLDFGLANTYRFVKLRTP